MEELIKNIDKIKFNLHKILEILNSLNSKNFYVALEESKCKIDEVNKIKEYLRQNFNKEELLKYDEELFILAKQIVETYDNIVRKKYQEKTAVALEIGRLQNKKKLHNYRR